MRKWTAQSVAHFHFVLYIPKFDPSNYHMWVYLWLGVVGCCITNQRPAQPSFSWCITAQEGHYIFFILHICTFRLCRLLQLFRNKEKHLNLWSQSAANSPFFLIANRDDSVCTKTFSQNIEMTQLLWDKVIKAFTHLLDESRKAGGGWSFRVSTCLKPTLDHRFMEKSQTSTVVLKRCSICR